MTARFPRPPVELAQHTSGGANTCIGAMAEYVFGEVERPDPYGLDRAVRRRSGTPLSDLDLAIHLMKAYFHCQIITPDTDKGLLEWGLAHIRRVHAGEWTSKHARYYDANLVAQLQAQARRNLSRKSLFASLYSEMGRKVTLQDIRRHLQDDHAIGLWFNTGGSEPERGLVVPDANQKLVWLYIPRLSKPSVLKRGPLARLMVHVNFGYPALVMWH